MRDESLFFLLVILLSSIAFIPLDTVSNENSCKEIHESFMNSDQFSLSSGPLERTIRVALYYEFNSTTPSYTIGFMNTNYSIIQSLLTSVGLRVDA